jgi:hypothetical protein
MISRCVPRQQLGVPAHLVGPVLCQVGSIGARYILSTRGWPSGCSSRPTLPSRHIACGAMPKGCVSQRIRYVYMLTSM